MRKIATFAAPKRGEKKTTAQAQGRRARSETDRGIPHSTDTSVGTKDNPASRNASRGLPTLPKAPPFLFLFPSFNFLRRDFETKRDETKRNPPQAKPPKFPPSPRAGPPKAEVPILSTDRKAKGGGGNNKGKEIHERELSPGEGS